MPCRQITISIIEFRRRCDLAIMSPTLTGEYFECNVVCTYVSKVSVIDNHQQAMELKKKFGYYLFGNQNITRRLFVAGKLCTGRPAIKDFENPTKSNDVPVQEMKVRIQLHCSQLQTMASRSICSVEADDENEIGIEGGKQQNPALVSTAF